MTWRVVLDIDGCLAIASLDSNLIGSCISRMPMPQRHILPRQSVLLPQLLEPWNSAVPFFRFSMTVNVFFVCDLGPRMVF